MILLIVICVILSLVAGFAWFEVRKLKSKLTKASDLLSQYEKALSEGQRAIDLALKYEEFYGNTTEELAEIVAVVDNLLNKRQLLSDDPDVQSFAKVLHIAHETLLGYTNARKEDNTKEKEDNIGRESQQ